MPLSNRRSITVRQGNLVCVLNLRDASQYQPPSSIKLLQVGQLKAGTCDQICGAENFTHYYPTSCEVPGSWRVLKKPKFTSSALPIFRAYITHARGEGLKVRFLWFHSCVQHPLNLWFRCFSQTLRVPCTQRVRIARATQERSNVQTFRYWQVKPYAHFLQPI